MIPQWLLWDSCQKPGNRALHVLSHFLAVRLQGLCQEALKHLAVSQDEADNLLAELVMVATREAEGSSVDSARR